MPIRVSAQAPHLRSATMCAHLLRTRGRWLRGVLPGARHSEPGFSIEEARTTLALTLLFEAADPSEIAAGFTAIFRDTGRGPGWVSFEFFRAWNLPNSLNRFAAYSGRHACYSCRGLRSRASRSARNTLSRD